MQELSIVKRLEQEGLLLRNSGTNSIKSLKEINSETNAILKSIDSKLGATVESLRKGNELREQGLQQDKKQHEEDVNQQKEEREDQKREKNKPKKEKQGFEGLKEALDKMKGSFSTVKEKAGEGGTLLKKIAGIGAMAFILKDVIDQWTGGKATEFINDIQGENGLFSQIKSASLAIGGLALLLAPGATLRLGFRAIGSLVRSDGLLRRGLSGFGRLFTKDGPLRSNLGNFRNLFARDGRLMTGLSSLGGRFNSLKNALGTRAGKAGLLAAITGATAAIASQADLIRGKTPGTPDTPRATGDVDGTRAAADANQQRVQAQRSVMQAEADFRARASTPDANRPAATVDTSGSPNATIAPSSPPPSGAATATPVATPNAAAGNTLSKADKLSIVAKNLAKNGLKTIPLVGAGLGAVFTAMRAWQGDWVGAGMEGAATFAPGPVGLPADLALAVRDTYADMYRAQYGVWPWNDTAENQEIRSPIIMKEAEDMVREMVNAKESGMYAPGQLVVQEEGTGRNKAQVVIDTATGEEVERFMGRTMAKDAADFVREHTMSADNITAPADNSVAIDQARASYQTAAAGEANIQAQISALGDKDVSLGYDELGFERRGYSDPEKQAQFEALAAEQRQFRQQKREAARNYANLKDNVQSTNSFGRVRGADDFDVRMDDADKIAALKARGFSDADLGRNDSLQSNFVSIDGAKYPLSALGQYENVLKAELVKTPQSGQGVRYDKATSPEAVKASSIASDMKSVIAPVIQQSTNPVVSKSGDVITNNFYQSSKSSIDPAAPFLGR